MTTCETEFALAEALEQAYRLALELLDVLDEARAAMVRPPPSVASAGTAGGSDEPTRPATPG